MKRGTLRLASVPAEWAGRVSDRHVVLKAKVSGGGMNKLERRWSQELDREHLAGLIHGWRYNAMRLELATGAWFKCDFWVTLADGNNTIRMDEVKGFWREAARVRIKVAARLYPEFQFRAVQWDGHAGWKVELIEP